MVILKMLPISHENENAEVRDACEHPGNLSLPFLCLLTLFLSLSVHFVPRGQLLKAYSTDILGF